MRRALIVEDDPDARDWLCSVVGDALPDAQIETAASVAEARRALDRTVPDLALVDLGLPDGSGTSVLAALRRLAPRGFRMVVTVFDDEGHILPALRAGAQGYLLKDEPRTVLIRQLHALLNHELPLSPSVARYVQHHLGSPR